MTVLCPLPAHSAPVQVADGLLVCPGCCKRAGLAVGDLPALHRDLAHYLTCQGSADGPKVAGTKDPNMVLNYAVAAHRHEIRRALDYWRMVVAEGRELDADSLRTAAPELVITRHVEWLCANEWGGETFVAHVTGLASRARVLMDRYGGTRRFVVGKCGRGFTWGECDGNLVAVIRPAEFRRPSEVICDWCEQSVPMTDEAGLRAVANG